jgi:hypothetical protein
MQLANAALNFGIVIQNPDSNTGNIAVGIDAAASAASPFTGAQLRPGRSAFFAVQNLDMIWITWTVAADEVTWWGG